MRKNQLTGFIRRERRVIGRVARFTIVWLLALSLGCLSCVRLRGRAPVPETVSTAGALTTGFAVEPDSMPEYRFGTLPRMGDVLVVGMTAAQLDELITEKYSEIIREPDVTVILREIGEQVVYVLGEVNKPGGYPLNPNGTTVLGAIAMAQGFMPTAKLSSVIIINKDIYGVPVASRLNLTRAVGGRGRENDPFLQGNEIVYVPATFITQLNQFVDQFFTKMISPFEFYLKGYDALHPDKRWRY
jgi:hypothetical protein